MLTFDTSDGSVVIDFPQNAVRVKAPLFGGLKRLRSERVRLARKAQDEIAAWEAEHPVPEGDGEEPADPVAVARRAEDRIVAVEQFNLAATEAWWRLVLLGDESFKRLTDDAVPENVDDWPSFLLFDVRPIVPANASLDVLLSAQSTPDRVVRHWGEAPRRSTSTNGAATPTNL